MRRWRPLGPSPRSRAGFRGCAYALGSLQRSAPGAPDLHVRAGSIMQAMTGVNALREHNRITWIEQEHGWIAAPEDVVNVLSGEGFEECKRETTTSRRDLRPAGGVWQGVNTGTGSVASAIWVNRPSRARATVFIAIDGESFRDHTFSSLERDPYRDDGGES